jgi:DnaJ domain
MNSHSSASRGRSRGGRAASPRTDRHCDHPGCAGEGLYRAPKNRESLREYYWFCLDHVRAYNRAWDFCRGMSADDIEAMIRGDIVGNRPTWPLGWAGGPHDERKSKLDDPFGFFDEGGEADGARKPGAKPPGPKSEADLAMETLGLTAPVTWEALRARYKLLVKRFHPDANGGDTAAEEKLKSINQAYATLKSSLSPA